MYFNDKSGSQKNLSNKYVVLRIPIYCVCVHARIFTHKHMYVRTCRVHMHRPTIYCFFYFYTFVFH